jgi:hypothetical protein
MHTKKIAAAANTLIIGNREKESTDMRNDKKITYKWYLL